MTALVSIFVLGTIWGAVYSLIAVGFTLIFGVAGIINLSHGAFYMLGAYLAYTFMTLLKINVPLSALMAVAGVALIGMAIDHFGIRPLRERHAYVLILTLAFALFFQELMYGIYGPYGKPVQSFVVGEIVLGGIHISYQKLITLFVAIASVILLWLFIKKTKTGKSISAVAQNKDAAILVGIQYEKAYRMTMGISAAPGGSRRGVHLPYPGGSSHHVGISFVQGFRHRDHRGAGKPGRSDHRQSAFRVLRDPGELRSSQPIIRTWSI